MYYALFLCVIVSIFLAGMIQFSGLNKKLESKLAIEEILVNNAYSGIAYAQAFHQELTPNKKTEISLYDEGIDSVAIVKKNWGAYQIIESKAFHKKQSVTKIAMLGCLPKEKMPTLYLADQGRALSLCGETKIEGLAYIPEAGIKRPYIGKRNYIGDKLLYGKKEKAEKTLPKINSEFLLNMNLVEGEKTDWNNEIEFLNCPFDSIPIHFFSENSILIENNQSFSGQIIIESTDSIVVSPFCTLKDVILKSPKIIVQSGFRGNFQCMASEKIVIEEDVILEYPSVLGLVEIQQRDESSFIIIGENSQIIGSVFLLSEVANFRKPIQLTIEENTIVNGFVYCNGETQLKGKINGSIYTQAFFLETKASSYQNHLLDAEIKNDLPEEFIPIPLLEESNKMKIIQWLN